MAETTELTGVQRAAILLLALGEQAAAEVLKHMNARQVQKLGAAMASLDQVDRDQVEQVLESFVAELERKTALGVGADEYVRKVLVSALGEDKAGSLIDRILMGRNSKGLEALKWMDPRAVAELVRNEHPQIIAIVLSHLDADQAAEVLGLLPERVRPEVILRIATLDGIQPAALRELDEIIERQFTGGSTSSSTRVGGIKTAANILNFAETALEKQIIEQIAEIDEELVQRIQDQMFVFDNLADLDDRSIQAVLREVPADKLGIALKGADPKVRDKILSNMSKRAAEILVEDMEARGPVRLSEVEAAQREILAIVRRLAEAGTVQLGAGEAFV